MAVLCALLAGLMVAGVFALSWPSRGVIGHFYQWEFAPAVMLACGQGYTAPAREADSPALMDFLHERTRSLDCGAVQGLRPAEPNFFQRGQMYLIGSVGLLWKITGIGWDRLVPFYAALYGLYALAVYGVFRLGAGRLLSLGAAIVLMTSTIQLDNLANLRDFAKAPFTLGTILLLGCMASCRLPERVFQVVAALAGVTLGIGIGFRMDLFMFIPLALLTILVVAPSGIRLGVRLGASLAFATGFVLVGWPILKAFSGGSNAMHVILLGLTSDFDMALRIAPSIYEWGYNYNDAYLSDIINTIAGRVGSGEQLMPIASAEYDGAARQYYLLLLSHFPADFAIRFVASIMNVLGLVGPKFLVYGMPGFLYPPLSFLAGIMPWLALAAAAAIFSHRPVLGVFFGLMILYLGGVSSLQYQERHVFHLQFISFWITLFLVRWSCMLVVTSFRGDWSSAFGASKAQRDFFRRRVIRAAIFACSATLLFAGVLGGLRLWQQSHLVDFLKTYEARATHPVSVETSVDKRGDVLVRLPSVQAVQPLTPRRWLSTRYWVAEFDGRRCGKDLIRFVISYSADELYFNTSRVVDLDIRAGAKYFFPTFELMHPQPRVDMGLRTLRGLEFADEDAACLAGVRQVGDIGDIALLLSLRLSPGWENQPLYQQLATERVRRVGRHTYQIYLEPRDQDITRSALRDAMAGVHGIPENTILRRAPTLARSDDGLEMEGKVEGVYSYVLQLMPMTVTDEAFLMVEGEVVEGGLTIGLVKDDQWAGRIDVVEAGRFIAVLRVGPGRYEPTIANNVPGHKTNHFVISKLAWVKRLGKSRGPAENGR